MRSPFAGLGITLRRVVLLAAAAGAFCGACRPSLEIDYAPLVREDWPVSSPAEQGLDPRQVADLYQDAEEVDTLYGLLVIKDGYLVAEKYYNGRSADSRDPLASVTKSITSALAGIALERGCLDSLDVKMADYFPDYAAQFQDPRKMAITLEQMLQMRSGYPWEEFNPPYLDSLFRSPRWIPQIVNFPLNSDPGTEFGYSNLTAHLSGVIVAKACGQSLYALAEENLFDPIGGKMGTWPYDPSGFNYGSGALSITARDAAHFGLLYLNQGAYQDQQILSSDWVEASLARYSTGIYGEGLGRYMRDIGYGYFWWSARSGAHDFNFAWGHGGNLIVLVPDLDLVIVTTADNLSGVFGEEAWEKESAIIDLVTKFISRLPET